MHGCETDASTQNEPAGHLAWVVDDSGQKCVEEHAIFVAESGQYEPSGQGRATDEFAGQYLVKGHGDAVVTPPAQYDPAGHTTMVLVVGQYEPNGQGVLAMDPDGQKLPALHGSCEDGVLQ